jgi:hypothetical protein
MNHNETIGTDYEFTIFNPQRSHDVKYTLHMIDKGWKITFLSDSGDCDEQGCPVLYKIMKNDLVEYPHNLGLYLSWLWRKANETELNHEQVQSHLNQLAAWVKNVTNSRPPSEFWKGI